MVTDGGVKRSLHQETKQRLFKCFNLKDKIFRHIGKTVNHVAAKEQEAGTSAVHCRANLLQHCPVHSHIFPGTATVPGATVPCVGKSDLPSPKGWRRLHRKIGGTQGVVPTYSHHPIVVSAVRLQSFHFHLVPNALFSVPKHPSFLQFHHSHGGCIRLERDHQPIRVIGSNQIDDGSFGKRQGFAKLPIDHFEAHGGIIGSQPQEFASGLFPQIQPVGNDPFRYPVVYIGYTSLPQKTVNGDYSFAMLQAPAIAKTAVRIIRPIFLEIKHPGVNGSKKRFILQIDLQTNSAGICAGDGSGIKLLPCEPDFRGRWPERQSQRLGIHNTSRRRREHRFFLFLASRQTQTGYN